MTVLITLTAAVLALGVLWELRYAIGFGLVRLVERVGPPDPDGPGTYLDFRRAVDGSDDLGPTTSDRRVYLDDRADWQLL